MAETAAQRTAPYRAQAVRDGEKWHLGVESLDDHPDRGEVDAVVVTVTPQDTDTAFPARDLDRTLGTCGFVRDGEWGREGERAEADGAAEEDEAAEGAQDAGSAGSAERWSVPVRQADPQAAPSNTPPPER